MKDLRAPLIKALIPAIKTATGKDAYTRMPKAENIQYPYIQISDIYQEEVGAKTKKEYLLDVLINVVYLDVSSLVPFYTDINNIMSFVDNDEPFPLESPFKILECQLNNSSTTEIEKDTGVENVAAIRLWFYVE